MNSVVGDALDAYLSRYRLRPLMDEWLDVVAQRRPEDPFTYLVGLINSYNQNGSGLVTCENKWCEMVIPATEYAAHLSTCCEEGKWVKCTRCNLRVEASCMRQHKKNCKLEPCIYCGEMVVPRLRDLCPYRLKMDAERAFRKQANNSRRHKTTWDAGKIASQLSPLLPPSSSLSSPPLPSSNTTTTTTAEPLLYTKRPLSFSSELKDRLICIQNLWRVSLIRRVFQDVVFKTVWRAVELYREKQATQECIAIPHVSQRSITSHHNITAFIGGCISVSRFEAVAKTITSGAVVEFATAKRIVGMAIGILSSRSLIQRVTIPEGGDVVVIGDLHGQMKDLCEVLVLTGGLPNPQRYFVFNGDFVDRGSNGMGVILYIFALLCAFPSFVFINRGNHEDTRVNAEYGFETEVYCKYGIDDAKRLLELLVDSYQAMPLMTLLDGMILIAHGGVPREPVTLERIESIGRIRNIPTAGTITEDEQIVVDILWNDPVENFHSRQLGLRHQAQYWRTSKRGCGVEYLSPITEEFLRLNNLRLIVRSHEEVQAGFELIHNGKCCTVFSASNYCGVSGNRAALAVFAKGCLKPVFHTWYVRSDEGGINANMTEELIQDLLFDNDKEEEEKDNDDGNNNKVVSTKKPNGNEKNTTEVGGQNDSQEPTNIIQNKIRGDGNHIEVDGTGTTSSAVEGKLMYNLNVLMILSDIIFRKRYALLSGFVAADYDQSGDIYKIEWCEVMRSVLEIDLPWYYLFKFVAIQREINGIPYVRYASFLKRFDARFSAQYLLPFQVAIVRRVFGGMDLPDDLLSRLDNTADSETTSTLNATVATTLPNKPFAGPSEVSRSIKTKSLTMRSVDTFDSNPSTRRGTNMEPWRSIKVDFNLLVSILRSQSCVAASLEDNAMYALFQYLDSDECGHVGLGNLVDLVDATLPDEEEEVEVIGGNDGLDLEISFSLTPVKSGTTKETKTQEDEQTEGDGPVITTSRDPPKKDTSYSKRKSDANSEKDDDTLSETVEGIEKGKPSKTGDNLRLSSLILFCSEENAEARENNASCRTPITDLYQPGRRRSIDENVFDALWLYPVLLRLHEQFDCGSLASLQRNFINLNRTGDGKLTFEQLNVALQLISRHMREPLTPEQARRIFDAVRFGGKQLSGIRHNDFFCNRSELHSLTSVTQACIDTKEDPEGNDVPDFSFITMNEFVSFFSITPVGLCLVNARNDTDSMAKGSRFGDNRDINSPFMCQARSEADMFLEDPRLWPCAERLGELTVGSFCSQFDSNMTLLKALQGLLCGSSVSAKVTGIGPASRIMSSRSSSRRAMGSANLATTASVASQKQLIPNKLRSEHQSIRRGTQPKSETATTNTTTPTAEVANRLTPVKSEEKREEKEGRWGSSGSFELHKVGSGSLARSAKVGGSAMTLPLPPPLALSPPASPPPLPLVSAPAPISASASLSFRGSLALVSSSAGELERKASNSRNLGVKVILKKGANSNEKANVKRTPLSPLDRAQSSTGGTGINTRTRQVAGENLSPLRSFQPSVSPKITSPSGSETSQKGGVLGPRKVGRTPGLPSVRGAQAKTISPAPPLRGRPDNSITLSTRKFNSQ